MATHAFPPILLSGRVVLADGGARQRYVLISEGSIRWISRSRPPAELLRGAREIVTGPQDWVFPGLIDLHTHTTYNVLPLWSSPRAPFDNRHVWRDDRGYRSEISAVSSDLRPWGKVRKVFSELQALAGGTTLLEEPHPLDGESSHGGTLLCRNTGSASDLGIPEDRGIRSIVDFFRPGRDGQPVPAAGRDGRPGPLDAYVEDRARLQAVLAHLAEGRSGFGSDRGVDAYSRAEFEAFMGHPAMADAEAVRASRLSLVHGCGIDVEDPRHLEFLAARGISVIWSPASNMMLYDDTIDVERLIERGINVALGSDWSPSGSKHVWDEARFARFFFNAIGSSISDADVFRMVTINAARCLGLPRFGRIEEGAAADLFILRSPIESDSALEVFFSTRDRDVLATIVDGLPIYGDRTFLSQFGTSLQPLPPREGSAVVDKVVHLPPGIGMDDFAGQVDALEDALKAREPAVYRSNLLADSDTPYLRRIHTLRARTERFGWSVKQWRKSPRAAPGSLPVPPANARVELGYRGAASREEFATMLGRSVLPARTRLHYADGLSAMLCAVAPADAPDVCPDEATLMFFGSRGEYERGAAATLGGRVAELLSECIRRPDGDAAGASFAAPFSGTAAAGGTYHLYGTAVDWQQGDVRVTILCRQEPTERAGFATAAAALLTRLSEAPEGRDGVIASLTGDALVLWEHAPTGGLAGVPLPGDLSAAAVTVQQALAGRAEAKASFGEAWPGFELAPGDCVRLEFERRDLFPW